MTKAVATHLDYVLKAIAAGLIIKVYHGFDSESPS
jgi:hypothetical protein